jgi:hypothetical protein
LFALAVAFATPVYAGFDVGAFRIRGATPNDLDRIDLFVINQGRFGTYEPGDQIDTGTALDVVGLSFQIDAGARAYFDVDIGGGPRGGDVARLTNPAEVPERGWVRLGTAEQTLIAAATPTFWETFPAGASPWLGGVNHFYISALAERSPGPDARVPYNFFRLYVDRGAGLRAWGGLQGDVGPPAFIPEFAPIVVPPIPEPGAATVLLGGLASLGRRTR